MPWFTPLPHRALISVAGEERLIFLQGVISNDTRQVGSGQAIWAALLTPQGKFLHEFFVAPHGDMVLLECEAARRDDLAARLKRYKLRSKVTIGMDDSFIVGAAWGDGARDAFKAGENLGSVVALGGGVVFVDPRIDGAGLRWLLPAADADLTKFGFTRATPAQYDAHRVALGLPDGSRDLEVEKALLLENGFEELHGVDFKKGCYVGQELTARTHYRALIKKRLMPVTINGAAVPGTALTLNGEDAGELRSVAGAKGLALVRLEAWRKAAGGKLAAGDATVTPQSPAWMNLEREEAETG
jgi:folate-binding protein YgfZ